MFEKERSERNFGQGNLIESRVFEFCLESRTVVNAGGGRILELDEEANMIEEGDSIRVNILLVVESASLDIGIGGLGSDIVAAIEEVDDKRCAEIEDDDVKTRGVDIDIVCFGMDESS
ncbi:hypothetical protein TNCV_2674011 [Trichonephila clavipes]|nr:hypothetical protein TNCV_2674011 [Trichonephila clavipes]